MDDLEKTANLNGLNEEQTLELKKVCCLYHVQKENMKPESFHIIQYNTYNNLSYFLDKIKSGKTPLEIMNNIITECEEYSRNQLIRNARISRIFEDARN